MLDAKMINEARNALGEQSYDFTRGGITIHARALTWGEIMEAQEIAIERDVYSLDFDAGAGLEVGAVTEDVVDANGKVVQRGGDPIDIAPKDAEDKAKRLLQNNIRMFAVIAQLIRQTRPADEAEKWNVKAAADLFDIGKEEDHDAVFEAYYLATHGITWAEAERLRDEERTRLEAEGADGANPQETEETAAA